MVSGGAIGVSESAHAIKHGSSAISSSAPIIGQVSEGPFLFGEFTIADAFFAPVVCRFVSYKIQIKEKMIKQYMKNIQDHHGVQFWIEEAQKEKPATLVF